MSNRDLENIKVEKDIAISMTREIGRKVAQVIKINFEEKSEIDNITRSNKILSEIENIEIKEAFKLEEER